MPTLLLIDFSPSTRQIIDSEKSINDILTNGCISFLKKLQPNDLKEEVAAISTGGHVISPFTTDITNLIETLTTTNLSEKEYSIDSAIKTSIDYIKESNHSMCQLIALLWQDHNCVGFSIDEFELQQFIKVHIISLNCIDGDIDKTLVPLEKLTQLHYGSFYNINVLYDDLETIKLSVQNLFETHYKDYIGYLTIGHLNSVIKLYPNPYMNQWSYIAAQNNLPIKFPTTLSIIGFSQMRTISSIPSVFRFAVLSESQDEPEPFLALLNESLKRLKKSAIVKLADEWYGTISSQSDYKIVRSGDDEEIVERSILVLNILTKELGLGWTNSLADHIFDRDMSSFIDLNYTPSYAFKPDSSLLIPSISVEQLEVDFAILTDLVQNLPEKREELFNFCEELRIKSLQFSMPGIMKAIVHVLNKDPKDDFDRHLIIKELIYQIEHKVEPIQWHELSEVKKEKTSANKRMNIASLLD